MLNEIEQAALTYLTERITAIRSAGIQKDSRGLLVNPSLSASCLEGSFKRASHTQWTQTITLSLLLSFKHAKGEEARRAGSNPLVEAIIQIMLNKKLGLDITKLQPLRWREITDEDAYTEGKNEYIIQFSTSYNIEELDEDAVEELLGIACDYLLLPGDDKIDAQDENLPEEP